MGPVSVVHVGWSTRVSGGVRMDTLFLGSPEIEQRDCGAFFGLGFEIACALNLKDELVGHEFRKNMKKLSL